MCKRIITCRECGASVEVIVNAKKRHCSKVCLDRWNNRRRIRGEKLYDLMMIQRCERPLAQQEGVYTILCRMVAAWREEDAAAGRESYYPMSELHEKVQPFRAVSSRVR